MKGLTVTNSRPEVEICRAARAMRYDLIVLGTSLRQGEMRFLSPRSAALVRSLRSPLLLRQIERQEAWSEGCPHLAAAGSGS